MTTYTRQQVQFASIECKLQMSGELSVAWMLDGLTYAIENSKQWDDGPMRLPTVDDVLAIGKLVEPNVNVVSDRNGGFRTVDVRVGYDVKAPWEEVPRLMVALMEALREPPYSPREGISVPVLTPDTFFKEYEEIHPFRDGNGRSGVILFNWLNGTLAHPVWAPNFWNDPRRTVGYGA